MFRCHFKANTSHGLPDALGPLASLLVDPVLHFNHSSRSMSTTTSGGGGNAVKREHGDGSHGDWGSPPRGVHQPMRLSNIGQSLLAAGPATLPLVQQYIAHRASILLRLWSMGNSRLNESTEARFFFFPGDHPAFAGPCRVMGLSVSSAPPSHRHPDQYQTWRRRTVDKLRPRLDNYISACVHVSL